MHKTLQKRVMIFENSTHYYHNAKTSGRLLEAFFTKTK